jgi:hypothetical protein
MSTPDIRALLKNAFLRIEELESQLATHEAERTEPVAIIGMACRFPAGAHGPESFVTTRPGPSGQSPADRLRARERRVRAAFKPTGRRARVASPSSPER